MTFFVFCFVSSELLFFSLYVFFYNFFCIFACIYFFFVYNTHCQQVKPRSYKSWFQWLQGYWVNESLKTYNIIVLILFQSDIQQAIIKKVWQPTTLKEWKARLHKNSRCIEVFNSSYLVKGQYLGVAPTTQTTTQAALKIWTFCMSYFIL